MSRPTPPASRSICARTPNSRTARRSQAEDVVYSVERLLKINQGPANLFAGVLKSGSVVAVDPHTVKFTLSKTFSPFLATMPAIRIVNSKLVKANAGADDGQTWLATHVASAGPYKLKSWERGTG